MQKKLHQKNARLNANHCLLFKRHCIHGNDSVAQYSQLLAREARRVRSSLMHLQWLQYSHLENQPHGQNLHSQRTGNIIDNVKSLKKYSTPASLFSSSSPFIHTSVSPFEHLSSESEQRANHGDNVQLNIAPPTRTLAAHPETTPSTLSDNELKPAYL